MKDTSLKAEVNGLKTRLATLDDIQQICSLYNEFFAYNAGLQPEYCKAAKEIGEYPKSVIADESAAILVAVEGSVIIGFVHIRKAQTPPFGSVVPHNYAEIIDYFVAASCRGKGIGAKLMNFAKQWSKAKNLEYIELSVLSNAREAIHFYERENFSVASYTMRCKL